MSQVRLAAHLGTAREVVFRCIRSLGARGLVSTSRGRIRLLDRDALAVLASGVTPAGPAPGVTTSTPTGPASGLRGC